MEVKKIKNIKEYLKFINRLYKNDDFYKDNKTDIINLICSPNSTFYKNSKQEMIGVYDDNSNIACQTILIHHKNCQDTLMLGFFEANPNVKKEVDVLIEYSKNKAKKLGCNKLLISMNGHCNYGLGILSNNFNRYPSFGNSYNSEYYNLYFNKNFISHKYNSYNDSLSKIENKILKFKKRLDKQNITFKYFDFFNKNFQEGINLYNKLNNTIFKEHSYYYQREKIEDLELFISMKPLLLDKNLIIAMKDNKPIGFLLWYPDYNELVSGKNKVTLKTILKYSILKQKPKKIILTEIGVLPEYENSGIILSLFIELYDYLYKHYSKNVTVCSGWIYEKNLKSTNLVKHILDNKDKEYIVYELPV